jgi:chromosome segregation ATPase
LRGRTTALAAGLAVLVLAACGGDDEASTEDFRELSERIAALGEDVGDALGTAETAGDRELAEQFEGFEERLGELRQDLEDLDPPEDLTDERDDLVGAMGDVRESLDGIAAAAEDGDPQAAREATLELVEGSTELRDAREALNRAVREAE